MLVLLAGCAGTTPLARFPWRAASGLHVGVASWWNGATLRGSALPRALGAALATARPRCGTPAPAAAYTLSLVLRGGRSLPALLWRPPVLWWSGCAYPVPPVALWLLRGAVAEAVREWSGRLLLWPQVAAAFPVGARATVTDWASGRSLVVVRWGGRLHADVEPATARDAVALRAIYGGSWSWSRRPVIVTLPDGTRVAASINGMPHGGQSVGGNAFPGHFCLHFLGTQVHGGRRIDERHLLAILAAAGVVVGGQPLYEPPRGVSAATAAAVAAPPAADETCA